MLIKVLGGKEDQGSPRYKEKEKMPERCKRRKQRQSDVSLKGGKKVFVSQGGRTGQIIGQKEKRARNIRGKIKQEMEIYSYTLDHSQGAAGMINFWNLGCVTGFKGC